MFLIRILIPVGAYSRVEINEIVMREANRRWRTLSNFAEKRAVFFTWHITMPVYFVLIGEFYFFLARLFSPGFFGVSPGYIVAQ